MSDQKENTGKPVNKDAIELYNVYIHGDLPRRDFLRKLAGIAGSAAAATMLLPLLEPNYVFAQQVATDDDRLETGYVEYSGGNGLVKAYFAKPAGQSGKLPGVLVIHENRGLNAHIEDVARRAALAGYVALAPDGLTYVGGALEDQEASRDLFGQSDGERISADVIAGVPYLAARSDCSGKLGSVGFCYGGGVALQCAAAYPDIIGAGVCFYGSPLDREQIAQVKAPLMMHYAGEDERINATIPEFRALLDEFKIAYSLHMYPGTGHGFHNDSSAARYNEAASKLAWQRTLNLFAGSLS
ncbi:MAG: dienelactone hydrolase family protein [Xanthomonadales bacterium]|nr:dienelactone hydrolase family protein [Xanthomonadales bacterium]